MDGTTYVWNLFEFVFFKRSEIMIVVIGQDIIC